MSGGILEAARDVQEAVTEAGFEFCFIGGLALQRWGEPRFTQDVDLTVLCPYGEEKDASRRLAKSLEPRFDGAIEFSAESRVFLARAENGTPVDIAYGAIDFEKRCVERAGLFNFGGGVALQTCSAEDLTIMKAFADRSRDWADIEGIILRQGAGLDWSLIEAELKPLLSIRGGMELWERLVDLRNRLT